MLLVLLAYLVLAPTPWDVGLVGGEPDWRKVSVRRWALGASWCAAAANAACVALLLVTRRRWLDGPVPEVAAVAHPARGLTRWQRLGVLVALITLASLSFTRLDASFWDDEVHTVERAVNGRYGDGPDGQLQFKPASWTETFFYYRWPNNHVPYSLTSRLGLQLWQAATGAERRSVSEAVVRAPAWLAALAMLACVATLLRQLGYPRAAPVAAAALALHPWILRYASEARGYSFVMLALVGGLSLLLSTWQRGSWPRWAAFGAAQLFLLWTFPGALWHGIAASLVAAAGIVLLHPGGAARRTQLRRWLVTHFAVAMGGLQVGLPLAGPLLLYLADKDTQRPVVGRWLENEAGYFFAGTPWRQPGALGPDYPQLASLAAEHPWLFWVTAFAAASALIAGMLRLVRLRDVRSLLVPLLLVPALLTWLQAVVTGSYLFEWYLVFALPGVAMLAAIGWEALPQIGLRRAGAALVALAFLGAFTFVTQPARSRLRAGSLQPLRESARLVRPEENPFTPGQDTILSASHTVPSRLYDPRVQLLRKATELRRLMAEADASGKALYVDHGWHLARKKDAGAFWELLQQDAVFEPVAVLPGWKPRLTRFVWRYRGGASKPVAPTSEVARPSSAPAKEVALPPSQP